jgi:hypothetical protein
MEHAIVVETLFGSHLYGLDTPTSDKDYKGIILPTADEILLGKSNYHIDKSSNNSSSKNTKDDIDRSFYSLSYFVDLACKGETVALDMLHGSASMLTHTSTEWDFLVANRHRFYTKSMKSYIGYVRKQAAKYGIKGSRVGELEKIINFLEAFNSDIVVGVLNFPESEFGKWIEYKGNNYYEFAGSKFQDNLKISYMLDTLKKIYANYGERSKLAKENLGVDWKAVSHCLRAGYQARDIFTKGSFEYPLNETEFLLKVKSGQLDFLSEVEPEIDRITKESLALSDASDLPVDVDRKFWNQFIVNVHKGIVVNEQHITGV